MSNNLLNTRCYLAGAMENEDDNGFAWRQKVKTDLKKLGIHWFDPYCKPIEYGSETELSHRELRLNREKKEIYRIKERMDIVRLVDLRMVDISDFLIVNIFPDIPTFGTHEEVQRATSQNKPVLVRIEGGITKAPFWWFSELNPGLFFPEFREIYEYLFAVNKADKNAVSKQSNNKWLFFNWMGKK